MLTQYSIVCQVPGAEPYTVCAYSGADLTQVLGITQAIMPEGHYGWVQECGNAVVSVSGQTQPAYADFRPNSAKRMLREVLLKDSQERATNFLSGVSSKPSPDGLERLAQLPPLLMEDGPYCGLIREARDVYVDGHFYACVAMCGISLERFQRDRAAPYGATPHNDMPQVRRLLQKTLLPETLELCEKMGTLRNVYAHGNGLNLKEDALQSLEWMHSFIDNETNLMRDYVVVRGMLTRKK